MCFLLHTFRAGGSRSETEFIGFVGRRARTEPESGLLFRFLPFQGSRSGTEFIGFAGWQARTEPESGLLFRFLPFQGSRSKTEFIGFAGWQARTEKAACRGNGVSVGVARRRRKGLRGARRQPGSPRAWITAPLLAWPNEGARACGKQGANREGRAPGINRRCWRGLTKAQGLAGSKAPTWKAARRGNGASVGVA